MHWCLAAMTLLFIERTSSNDNRKSTSIDVQDKRTDEQVGKK